LILKNNTCIKLSRISTLMRRFGPQHFTRVSWLMMGEHSSFAPKRQLFGSQKERNGGRRWIRTIEGVSQQIYSLPPLATWVSYRPSRAGRRLSQTTEALSICSRARDLQNTKNSLARFPPDYFVDCRK